MPRPTIILIHGYRGTHHGLQLIAKDLKNVEVIIPDLPGFAKGQTMASYDLGSYVEWLHQFIKDQGLKTVPFLLGHSFGSIISAAYAATYPKTIKKLILVNPIGAPALEGPRAILSQLVVFYYWIGTRLPKNVARTWLASQLITDAMTATMTKSKDKKLRRFIYDQHRHYFSTFHDARSAAEGFRTSITNSVRDFASTIKTPTLIIAGEQDDITSLPKQYELQKLFPDAKIEVIKNVGHLTHYETPDQVAKLIQAFIKVS